MNAVQYDAIAKRSRYVYFLAIVADARKQLQDVAKIRPEKYDLFESIF